MVRHLVRSAVPTEGITRIIFAGNNGNLMARAYSELAQTTAIGFPTQVSMNRNGLFAWLDHSELREDLTMDNYMNHMRREIAHTNGQEYTVKKRNTFSGEIIISVVRKYMSMVLFYFVS